MKKQKDIASTNSSEDLNQLYSKISNHIDSARNRIYKAVDTEMVVAYFNIGRDIVLEEQKGEKRAEYGKVIIKTLSEALTENYGKGFGISTLRDIRQFYLTYKDTSIHHAVRGESSKNPIHTGIRNKSDDASIRKRFTLGWIHYRALMRVDRLEARNFYEIEAINNKWSGRELQRQIHSLLYDRLAKSKDKKGLLKLVNEGQTLDKPSDAIRDPMILEFLDIPESNKLVESKLEEALISNLQEFLLELGKGFAFIARQKRLTFGGQHYYADLVFYHTILKCYCIIDLKTKSLSHGDLGQIQLYTNYFDKEIKAEDDNPTIGLVLCTDKNDKMVEYFLGDQNKQIFASKYQFHLPSVQELEKELKAEIKKLDI